MTIDLNCDMGEIPEDVAGGAQEALMRYVTSVNIACGGHAGDERTMRLTIGQALKYNVAIGAHPGYPDRENFGRRTLDVPLDEVKDFVREQVAALVSVAARCGAAVTHVKPHGALYNQAVKSRELAQAIAEGVAGVSRDLILVGLAGSAMVEVFRKAGFRPAEEAYADRRYEPDGTLRPRSLPDALVSDPEEAAGQALRIARGEAGIRADTLCIHGDSPGALAIVERVAARLRGGGVRVERLRV